MSSLSDIKTLLELLTPDALKTWLAVLMSIYAILAYLVWNSIKDPETHLSNERVTRWFRNGVYGSIYHNITEFFLRKIALFIGDNHKFSYQKQNKYNKNNLIERVFGFNPWSVESYQFSLVIAFFYPFALFIVFWVLGSDGRLGSTPFMRQITEEYSRWISVALLLLLTLTPSLILKSNFRISIKIVLISSIILITIMMNYDGHWATFLKNATNLFAVGFIIFSSIAISGQLTSSLINRNFKKFDKGVLLLALVVSLSFSIGFTIIYSYNDMILAVIPLVVLAITFSVASINAISTSTTIMTSIAITLAVAFTGSGNGINKGDDAFDVIKSNGIIAFGIFSIMGIFYTINHAMYKHLKKNKNNWLVHYWLLYSLFLLGFIIMTFALGQIKDDWIKLLFFLLILPLINTPFDWLSLGVTRGLLHAIVSEHHSTLTTLLWAALDIILALILLFSLTSIGIFTLALGNTISGKELFEINMVLDRIKSDPSNQDNWWIYAMLLTTLIPTFFHFLIACTSIVLLPSKDWLSKRAEELPSCHFSRFWAWIYLSLTPIIVILVTIIILYGIFTTFDDWVQFAGKALLEWSEFISTHVNPSNATKASPSS